MPKYKRKRDKGRRTVATSHPRQEPSASSSVPTTPADVDNGWLRMKLSAELLEDAHPGTGSGGGGIDALVARDRRGRPVIWATHLEGVLRDAARRLRGDGVAAQFFGRGGGQQQRAIFTSLYCESAPKTRVWRSSARAAFDNRAPLEDTLRAVEHVAKGTRFEGWVEMPAADRPLLRRLVQEVDALGSGRASGAGRVNLSLSEVTISPRAIGGATCRLLLLLRNLDPLTITATATPDNLIPSLAFVPGRALVGSLASWLINEGHQDAAAPLVNGQLSVSDALPVPHAPANVAATEILPAPLALQSEKPVPPPGSAPWWAEERPELVRRLDRSANQAEALKDQLKLKRPEDDLFVYRGGPHEPWSAFRPGRRVRLRNGRPNPNQDDPALFAIEQIVEGTWFLCEIRGKPSDMSRLATALKPVLEGRRWLRVGRAGAPVEVAQLAWTEETTVVAPLSRAILTLTSDLLVRDDYLRWCTSLDDERLQKLPGRPANIHLLAAVQETVAVHGFNGTSRLWRMPAYGIRRGSVFRIEGEGVAELARMIAAGKWLGERTHEGFGRFRLDDILPGVGDGVAAAASSVTLAPDEPEETIAKTTRQWFQEHSALTKVGGSAERRPSLSQWHDLVADLERNKPNALTSRQNPTTAGEKNWSDSDAKAILNKLDAIPSVDDRKSHARLFVRWLRAEMRGGNK